MKILVVLVYITAVLADDSSDFGNEHSQHVSTAKEQLLPVSSKMQDGTHHSLSIPKDDYQLEENPRERRRGKTKCRRRLGGRCVRRRKRCPGHLPSQTSPGKPYCSKFHRCCYQDIVDCEIDGIVYPNGFVAENRCILLKCNNGTWEFNGRNDVCGMCYAYKVGVTPYVAHNISGNVTYGYDIADEGTYVFSQSSLSSPAQFGVDIAIELVDNFYGTFVTDVIYYEPGITIELSYFRGHAELLVNPGNGPGFSYIFDVASPRAVPFTATLGTVFVIFEYGDIYYGWIYIVGSQGLSVYVYFDFNIYEIIVMATPSLYDEVYGLCDVLPAVAPPYSEYWTMSYDGLTNDTNAFIGSWKHHQNPSREQTLQDTDRTVIERSSSEIEKKCEEMNKGPCTGLPSEECESLKEACVSRMSDAGIPGNRTLSESSG